MEAQRYFERVILIEDNEAHALLIRRALHGYVGEVVHAASIAAGLAQLGAQKPDLVITDLHLPDTTGVLHVAKIHAALPVVPIVVLTSSTSLQDAVEAMKLGARDFLVKSFDQDFREVLGLCLMRLFAGLEVERERARLQREMSVLRVAIENSNDGLGIVDSAGTITYANSAFRSFARLCGDGVTSVDAIFSPRVNDAAKLRASVERKRRELSPGSVWHTEILFADKKADKKEVAFDFSLSILDVAQTGRGAEQLCVLWVRDISEVKRRDRFQREILSTTTHDLKGPLGAIVVSTELLQDLAMSEARAQEIVVRIASSAQGAINLIDEFLSARRIQEGTFILRPAVHPVIPLVDGVLQDFQPIARSRGITLVTDSALPPDATAPVDKLGFVRVLGNLLSNAIKFTAKGGGVTVRLYQVGDELHVQVQDTGTGMEPAEVKRLFERFSRLDRHSDIAGTGLGLFVVKSVVGAHGGKIEVTSKVGEGTTFDVSYPRTPPVNERGELISLDFA